MMCTLRTGASRLIVASLLVTSSCKDDERANRPITVTVFAASSLTEAFVDLETAFEANHPDVDLALTFAGSQVLRLQLEQGARADVFASANETHMEALIDQNLVASSTIFAENELVVIVPEDNPAGLESFRDLPNAKRIVLGTRDVPVGAYSERLLQASADVLGEAFAAGVHAHVVSRENNVRLVRAKVELGEADAAIVYRTDAAASRSLRTISIPKALRVAVSHHIGLVGSSDHSELAEQFIAHVQSQAGRDTLREHGFEAP